MALVEYGADHHTVWLRGELDSSAVPDLADTIARTIVVDRANLVVDLSAVKFITAAAMDVLVRTEHFLEFQSRSLTMRGTPTGYGAWWQGTDD